MIRPLRSVHRGAMAALLVLLPAVLASAWKVRHELPRRELDPRFLPGLPADSAAAALADVLIYWSASEPSATGLPLDAEWVGSARSGAHRRTPPAGKHILAFDLAHGELVPLEELP